MQTVPLQLSDVIYNAATQSFEALVTVHDHRGVRSYACAIEAPITMAFEDAAKGLATQAMRRHTRGRPDSIQMPWAKAPGRAGRITAWRRALMGKLGTQRPHAA